MLLQKKSFFIILILLGISFTLFSGKYDIYFEENQIKTDKVEMTFSKSSMGVKYIIIETEIKNISTKEIFFNTDDFELLDLDTGIAAYSFSKDADIVSMDELTQSLNPIIRINIKPGRVISGTLVFKTPNMSMKEFNNYKAFANLKLIYQDKEINMYRGKMKSKIKK